MFTNNQKALKFIAELGKQALQTPVDVRIPPWKLHSYVESGQKKVKDAGGSRQEEWPPGHTQKHADREWKPS